MFVSGAVFSQEWKPQTWPVLKQYDREHLYQVALPLGGIGTGTVSLGGRGELRDCIRGKTKSHNGDSLELYVI